MKKLLYSVLFAITASFGITSCVDDDPVDDAYYTFTGEMVTDYLEHRSDNFSEFIGLVKRAKLWDLLSTYGEFTCFAPTNDAIRDYLRLNGHSSTEELSDAECDTLVWHHLIKTSYFTTDLQQGSLPTTNMNDRYLVFSLDTINGRSKYFMNSTSEMIARDDSVENGVVHTLASVLSMSSTFLGDALVKNERCSIFGQALELTGLKDTLSLFIDKRYNCSIDSTTVSGDSPHHRTFGGRNVFWKYPQQRKLMFTVFVEPDSIYNLKGIKTLEDLKAYAKKIYDNTYPEDAGKYDDDWTNRRNPLNRFIAYHILDRYASYSEMTLSNSVCDCIGKFFTDKQDIQEFYETLCPFTLLKVCDAAGDKWVNRRGVGANRLVVRGCRILDASEAGHSTDELNGLYHYIDDILVYDKENTIGKVLNCRMRFDATTLSPDFMNAGARNADPKQYTGLGEELMTAFKPGFTKNFQFSDKTFFAVHCRFYWNRSYESDMCACLDNFDFKFRIPPVPAGETYEIRLGYVAGNDRGVVQIYMDDNGTGDIPCGIPLDLRQYGGTYGWQSDNDLGNDPAEIEANDKALRNQGFMKGTACCQFDNGGTIPRNEPGNLRRILATQYIEPEHSYYLRMRQVLENLAEFSFDYIEVVPKSVYDGTKGEDKY